MQQLLFTDKKGTAALEAGCRWDAKTSQSLPLDKNAFKTARNLSAVVRFQCFQRHYESAREIRDGSLLKYGAMLKYQGHLSLILVHYCPDVSPEASGPNPVHHVILWPPLK